MVVEVPEIIWGGSRDYMVSKPILVFSLSLSHAAEEVPMGRVFPKTVTELMNLYTCPIKLEFDT